jgi:hypothetical protein
VNGLDGARKAYLPGRQIYVYVTEKTLEGEINHCQVGAQEDELRDPVQHLLQIAGLRRKAPADTRCDGERLRATPMTDDETAAFGSWEGG